MTDDGLMIRSTSSKDVGTYECMVKKENIELKSRPAKIILEPDASGCECTDKCIRKRLSRCLRIVIVRSDVCAQLPRK